MWISITLRTSIEKSSKGAASTTLIVSLLLGCTVANPLDTEINMFVNVSEGRERQSAEQEPTNEFLAAVGLDDLYNTGTKSFNRGNVI